MNAGNSNGSASLYLMLGEVRSDVKHLISDVSDVRQRVGHLELQRDKPAVRGSINSIGITGKQWLAVALAIGMGLTGTVTPELFRNMLFGP